MTRLPNGTDLKQADDLKHYLLTERREHFARSIVRRMASYSLGRSLDLGDRETLEELQANFLHNNLRLRGLIVDLVTSDLFTKTQELSFRATP